MIERIAVLGGSSVYIPEFVHSIISRNLNVQELALVGRNTEKLELVARFCQRLLDKSGYPTRVIGVTSVEEGIAGASYILNNVRVGGMKARLRDEKLPPKLGMVGDDSLGAGGFANALRTLPVVLEHARIIEAVNPEAVFINMTNPMGMVVEALIKHTQLRVLGVSDLPRKCIRRIAELTRLSYKDLKVNYIGLSHMGWIQDVKVNDRSCMARLLDVVEQNKDEEFDRDVVALFRMIPTRSLSPYFHRDVIVKRQRNTARYRAEVLYEAEMQLLKMYEDERLTDLPDLARARNAVWYHETVVPLILALEGETDRDVILCLKNDGAIRDLPVNCSVDLMSKVSKGAATPYKVGGCPHFLRGIFVAVKESERLTVEAVRHRSYEQALQALAVNPLVPGVEAAKTFLDRVLKEEQIELH